MYSDLKGIEDAILRESDMYFISTVKSRLVHELFDRFFRLLPILTKLGYILKAEIETNANET